LKRFGLSAAERVKRKIEFKKLYASGKIIISSDKKIKAVYLIEKIAGAGHIKVAIAVSNKAGNAVWRNRVKRLLRAAYQLNKENLFNISLVKNFILEIIISPYHLNKKNNQLVIMNDVIPGTKDVLLKIERSL
jgi:ribonuclease P protein component